MTEPTGSSADCPSYAIPAPGTPQCEADGVRNGPDGPGGTEHYWTCTAPGTVDVDGELLCEDHAGERGYGPKQEEYGFDPDERRILPPQREPAAGELRKLREAFNEATQNRYEARLLPSGEKGLSRDELAYALQVRRATGDMTFLSEPDFAAAAIFDLVQQRREYERRNTGRSG